MSRITCRPERRRGEMVLPEDKMNEMLMDAPRKRNEETHEGGGTKVGSKGAVGSRNRKIRPC